ncbi:hypothetical protein HYW32_03630 [Candidatus Berkelbacteria bacterium]|nr:hypothetical protein [Candidatus Berkelbacteria bacterium]
MHIFEIEQAILANQKVVRKHLLYCWEDVNETLDLCYALGRIFYRGLDQLKRSEKRNFQRCLNAIRKATERIDSDKMIAIANAHRAYTVRVGMNFATIFLGSDANDFERSEKIVSLLHQARIRTYPDELSLTEQYNEFASILSLIGTLIHGASRTWTNFLRSVASGSQTAGAIFDHIVFFYASVRANVNLVHLSEWPFQTATNIEETILVAIGGEHDPVFLPVPDEIIDAINGRIHAFNAWIDRQNILTRELVAWFQTKRDDFHSKEEQMWQEIVMQPKYGLRPAGLDKLRVDLADSCETYVQLIPVGDFPLTHVKLWMRYRYLRYWYTASIILDPNNWQEVVCSDCSCTREGVQEMDRVHRFVCLYCLWWIVTGQGVKASTYHEKGGKKSNGFGVPASKTPIRAHFRRLPLGRNPSEAAQLRAIDTLDVLPPIGTTFVRSHLRNNTPTEQEIRDFEKIEPLPNFIFSFSKFGFA